MNTAGKASNVLLAKCRARYGRALSYSEIEALLACRSRDELISALRSTKKYSAVLSGYDDSSLHRRMLESLIDKALYDDLSTLCRYELSVGEWFGDYILLRGEIEQLTLFLRLFASGRQSEFLSTLPEYLIKHASFNFAKLGSCRSYDDFIKLTRRSRFYKLLSSLAPSGDSPPDCAVIEQALWQEFYVTIISLIEENAGKGAREELMELVGTRLDLLNFCHLYRLKKYYGASDLQLRSRLIDRRYKLSKRLFSELINAETAEQALDLFIEKSPYGKRLDTEYIGEYGIESACDALLYTMARRRLQSSINSTAVLLSYVMLAEAEARDLKTIIEGVFYKTPPDIIRMMIRIDDFARQVN